MTPPRYVLRAAAERLPYNVHLARSEKCPPMHRAQARREMRRRRRHEAQWLADFLARL